MYKRQVLGGVQAKFADRHFNSNIGYGYQYDYGGVVAIDPKLFEMLIARQFPYYLSLIHISGGPTA